MTSEFVVSDGKKKTGDRDADLALAKSAAEAVPELPPRRVSRSLVGIAAVAVLGGLLWLLVIRPTAEQPTVPHARRPEPVAAPHAAAIPVSTETLSPAVEDSRFTATSTPSVLSLPTDIEVLLEPGGRLALDRVDRSVIEVPSVKALLDEAERAWRQKHWDAAVDMYKEMIRLYPAEKASSQAEVALGNLLLDRIHHPAEALDYFARYLDRGDTALSEEALFGKARALRSLGRVAAEKEALLEFVEKFPHAMNIEDVRQRLGELENGVNQNRR